MFEALIGPVADLIGKVVDRVIPDPIAASEVKLKVAQLQQTGELAALAADTDLAKAQLNVNAVEASNSSLWVSGWRPYVGWICGTALAYVSIVEPVARFVARVKFGYVGDFPVLETSNTIQILTGMLGFAALRTYEKKQGVA